MGILYKFNPRSRAPETTRKSNLFHYPFLWPLAQVTRNLIKFTIQQGAMKHFPNPQVWEMSLMYISLEQTTLKVINVSNKQFWMQTFNFFYVTRFTWNFLIVVFQIKLKYHVKYPQRREPIFLFLHLFYNNFWNDDIICMHQQFGLLKRNMAIRSNQIWWKIWKIDRVISRKCSWCKTCKVGYWSRNSFSYSFQ